MSDVTQPGYTPTCVENAKAIARHEEQLKSIRERLEQIEGNQKELQEVMTAIREKIFDGYDENIRHTSKRVDEIMVIVTQLAERGGIDMSAVMGLVENAITEYDNKSLRKAQEDSRWWKKHKLEILAGLVGVCTLAVGFITVLALLGVIP